MSARIGCYLVSLAISLPASASPAAHLLSALETSDAYAQSQQNVKAAERGIEVRKAALKPQGRASLSYSLTRPEAEGNGDAPSRVNRGLNISQTLFNLGRYHNVRVAELDLNLAEHRRSEVRQQILLTTYRSYLASSLAQESLALIDRRMKQLAEQLRFADTAFEVGSGSQLDIVNVKAQIASLNAERIEAADRLVQAQRGLSSQSGRAADDILSLKEAPAPPDEPDFDSWLKKAKEAPSVLAALTQVTIQEASIDQKRGEILPAVSLEANSNLEERHTLQIQAQIPLFSSGAATSEVERLNIVRESLIFAYRQTLEDSRLAITNAFEAMEYQQERIRALTDSVAIARERLELTNKSVALNASVLRDALSAESDLAAAELALLDARHAQLQSWLNLLASAGMLDMQAAVELEKLFR